MHFTAAFMTFTFKLLLIKRHARNIHFLASTQHRIVSLLVSNESTNTVETSLLLMLAGQE